MNLSLILVGVLAFFVILSNHQIKMEKIKAEAQSCLCCDKGEEKTNTVAVDSYISFVCKDSVEHKKLLTRDSLKIRINPILETEALNE